MLKKSCLTCRYCDAIATTEYCGTARIEVGCKLFGMFVGLRGWCESWWVLETLILYFPRREWFG